MNVSGPTRSQVAQSWLGGKLGGIKERDQCPVRSRGDQPASGPGEAEPPLGDVGSRYWAAVRVTMSRSDSGTARESRRWRRRPGRLAIRRRVWVEAVAPGTSAS